MADDEPNLSGNGPSGDVPGRISFTGVRESTKELKDLCSALKCVTDELKQIVSQEKAVVASMTRIANASKAMNAAMGQQQGTGTTGTGSTSFNYANASQMAQPASATAGGAAGSLVKALSGGSGGGSGGGGTGGGFSTGAGGGASGPTGATDKLGLGSIISGITSQRLGGVVESIAKLGTIPVKYAHDRIEENRAASDFMAESLGNVSTMSGRTIEDMIAQLGTKTPVYGEFKQILQALSYGSRAGYGLGPGNEARSGAFYANIRQQQAFTPGVGADELAANNIGYLNNTQTQQRSMMLTGGAFSSFGPGGVPKTLQEWSESILKFFENQRPGSDRGKSFTKEELQTQFFPGSNMNAWFASVGVPQYMQDYFWQYAIGKSNATGSSGGTANIDDIVGMRGADLARENLQLNTAKSRREFSLAGVGTDITSLMNLPGQLAGKVGGSLMPGTGLSAQVLGSGGTGLYGQYVKRSKSDRTFQGVMGRVDNLLAELAGATVGGPFASMPTPIAELMYDLMMSVGPSLAGKAASMVPLIGDPDTGWGDYGGTGFIGMDPSFAGRLQAMMADNPNISITSGYRDGPTQDRLHRAGHPNVAPAGQSFHSKGLAADLGPPEEFGWIAANAHKYGLENAAHMGEPWHVGFPGTVPMGDPGAKRRASVPIGDMWDALGGAWNATGGKITGKYYGEPSTHLGPAADQYVRAQRMAEQAGVDPMKYYNYAGTAEGMADPSGQAPQGGGWNPLSGIGNAIKSGFESIPGLGMISTLANMISPLSGMLGMAGKLFGGVGGLLSGDFSGLFGQGGPFAGIQNAMTGGVMKLLGIPALTSGSAADISKGFAGFLGGAAKTGGMLQPTQKSTLDTSFSYTGGSGGASTNGSMNGAPPGGAALSSGVSQIINKYGGGAAASAAKIDAATSARILTALDAASKAGFKGDELVAITSIAGRESGWHPGKRNPNASTGDNSFGLYQINMLGGMGPARRKEFGISKNEDLYDPYTAARAAYKMSGGNNFYAWGPYKKKAPLFSATQYVEPVYNLAKQHGYIGDPQSRLRSSLGTDPVTAGASPTVNAYITVGGGGGMGDSEARRVGSVIADTLEGEMKSRLARSY